MIDTNKKLIKYTFFFTFALVIELGLQAGLRAAPTQTYDDAPSKFGRPSPVAMPVMQDVSQASQTAASQPASKQTQGTEQSYSLADLSRQQQDVIALQKAHARCAEVTVLAPVCKLMPDEIERLQHQRFLLRLTNGTTILVAHDTSYAPHVPVQLGSIVRIHGEYIWNQRGGLIHWTHLSDTPFHDSGWIDYQGKRYQ